MPRRLARKDTRGRGCHASWLAMTESRLARKDGKIIVIARSEAIAERRGNLAKSLSGGREGLPRLLARKDTEGEDCFAGWLAMTDER